MGPRKNRQNNDKVRAIFMKRTDQSETRISVTQIFPFTPVVNKAGHTAPPASHTPPMLNLLLPVALCPFAISDPVLSLRLRPKPMAKCCFQWRHTWRRYSTDTVNKMWKNFLFWDSNKFSFFFFVLISFWLVFKYRFEKINIGAICGGDYFFGGLW